MKNENKKLTAHDRHIREPLFDYLEDRYGKIRIIEEKRTGRARADVVMVTPDAIYGIEIKSDNDTYTRLAGQVKNYNIYYDYNIVAVGSSHAAHIEEHVPKWWGIITIEDVGGKLDFYTLREAFQVLRSRMNARSLDEIRPRYKWNESCHGSVPAAMRCFYESTDYESFIRNIFSLECDSDTFGAIAGGVAEEFYGGFGDVDAEG